MKDEEKKDSPFVQKYKWWWIQRYKRRQRQRQRVRESGEYFLCMPVHTSTSDRVPVRHRKYIRSICTSRRDT